MHAPGVMTVVAMAGHDRLGDCLSFAAIRSRFVQRACAVAGSPQGAARCVRG
jgi:hypothetical protein